MGDEWLTSANSIAYLDHFSSSAASIVNVDFNDYSLLTEDWMETDPDAASALSYLNLRKKSKSYARQKFTEMMKRKMRPT